MMSEYIAENKSPDAKQQVIDRIGRITERLFDRAIALPGMYMQPEPLEWHLGICTNVSAKNGSMTVGDARFTLSQNSKRKAITVSVQDEEEREEIHRAYFLTAGAVQAIKPARYGIISTESKELYRQNGKIMTVGYDGDVYGYAAHNEYIRRSGGYGHYERRPVELRVSSEDGTRLSDSEIFLGRVNENQISTETLISHAIAQSAHTLVKIRGVIAEAERQSE